MRDEISHLGISGTTIGVLNLFSDANLPTLTHSSWNRSVQEIAVDHGSSVR